MRDIYRHLREFARGHVRRISCATAISVIFICSASFCSIEAGDLRRETIEEGSIYLETDDGLVKVDRLDRDFSFSENEFECGFKSDGVSISADDLQHVIDSSSQVVSTEKAEVDKDTVIDSETGENISATYANDWSLILINKEHLIPDDYEFELATIKGSMQADIRVIPHVRELLEKAQSEGVDLYICSPYRDMERQTMLFERKIKSYTRQGYSYEEAYDLASQTVTIPGSSEHNAGLAFDFVQEDYQQLDAGFANTRAGRWLYDHAAEYGFILRYPKGKEDITKIEFEPWHYRYVGVKAAKEIMSRGITLEEYDEEIGLVE